MTKYKQAVADLIAAHEAEFDKLNGLKIEDPQFNEIGKPLLRLIEEAENRLCGKMEGGKNGVYSMNLAEKFRQELKTRVPLAHMIGVTIS